MCCFRDALAASEVLRGIASNRLNPRDFFFSFFSLSWYSVSGFPWRSYSFSLLWSSCFSHQTLACCAANSQQYSTDVCNVAWGVAPRFVALRNIARIQICPTLLGNRIVLCNVLFSGFCCGLFIVVHTANVCPAAIFFPFNTQPNGWYYEIIRVSGLPAPSAQVPHIFNNSSSPW